MENNEAPHHCSICKGQCCKSLAGSYIPEDIGTITIDNIMRLLDTGKYAIDCWDGDARFILADPDLPIEYNLSVTRYLRPRHVGSPAIAADYSPQTCINLTDNGCSLSFKDRPFQCKALVPNFNKRTMKPNCIIKGNKATRQAIAVMWIPYQEVLEKVVSLYRMQQEG